MNVEEYLDVTNGETAPPKKDGEPDSDLEDNLSLNDPDDIQKNLARFEGIDSNHLHGEIAQQFGVEYLAPVTAAEESGDFKQANGKMIAPNHRWIVDIPCRRETPCPPGVNLEDLQLPQFRHVLFVVDTSSPQSYLSVEAMQALSSKGDDTANNNDNLSTSTIPDFIDVELRNGNKVEFHLSPGNNEEVNILGATVLQLADVNTNVRAKEFFLNFIE